MPSLASTLTAYRHLLGEVDDWFTNCLQTGGPMLACRGGCSACCRALFDITLLDAWLLKEAFARLPKEVQAQVIKRCQPRRTELLGRWPELNNPYLLNALPESEWSFMPEADQTPCPLLDENGFCLIYTARPMTCRLHGLPNIDVSGEDFDGTVCTLHAGNPLNLPEGILNWRFREVFAREIDLFRGFTKELTGGEWTELDTFIPLALLADYSVVDWCNFKL